jgi:hypothetical protein
MIELHEFPYPLIEVFSPEGENIGNITSQEMLADLRLQICKAKAVGWTLHWNGQVITVEPSGDLSDWPVGMADKQQSILAERIQVMRNNR